jgi:hypothetical protein
VRGPFRRRRSWASRLGELLVWVGVAVLTAVVLVLLSDRLLPTNF